MSAKSWQKVLSVLVLAGLFLSMVQPGGVRAATPAVPAASSSQQSNTPEVEAKLLDQFKTESTAGYLIYFRESPDLSAAQKMGWEERGWYVMNTLKAAADKSQANVRVYLDGQNVQYESFWIDNVIAVENSSRATLDGLMAFSEIESLKARRIMGTIEPEIVAVPETTLAIEPNISHVGAPSAWALGINGEGSVVASIDTGVRYTHEALVNHYRGNLGGGVFEHNYNWWDPYGDHPASPADDNGHGSHTMGTMVGDDGGANRIGMAPGAKWLACRGCNTSSCTDAALLGCAQFLAAPTNLAGNTPDPAKRPNTINNSWGDCSQAYDNWYQGVVDAWHAAGIYPVFSNGNASNCSYPEPPGPNTVGNPGRYGNVTGVGSSGQSNGLYATHSNWGPTDNPDTINPRGYPSLKPQVIAPGVNIRSSVPTSDTSYQGGWSGTSMSAPHVTGLVALVWQAGPCLVGDYAATETLIEETAIPVPYDDQTGGGAHSPNNATGWGEINALAAVQAALNYCGDSTLTGRVVETTKAPGDPIVGAIVAATSVSGTYQTLTNDQGYYTLTLWANTYDVSVSAFGYQLWQQNDVVINGPVTLNPSLTLADWFTVSGDVTDSATDWPLYAKITIDGYPGDPIWTDPETGAYSISLPEGVTYTFDVEAFYPGYVAESLEVGPLTANTTENFALDADLGICTAPGYVFGATNMFAEDFASATTPALPADWAVVDVSGTAGNWATSATTVHPSGQAAHSTPNLAYFNAYSASSGSSTRLNRTTGVDLSGVSQAEVAFWMYHDTGYTSATDRVEVQVSTDAGTTWTTVGTAINRYNGSTGWALHTVNISTYTGAGMTDVRVGLLATSAYGNDVHVDDISVRQTSCLAPVGGLVIGNVYDAQTLAAMNGATVENDRGLSMDTVATADDAATDDGFYYLFADPGDHVFTATYPLYGPDVATVGVVTGTAITQDFYLPVGQLAAVPSALEVVIPMGMTGTVPLTLTNLGGAAVNWEVTEKDLGFLPTVNAGEDVLVVRYDTTAADAVQAALTANGFTYLGVTEAAFQAMTVEELSDYSAVFFMGNPAVAGASELKMQAYLDAGGSLYISDNDLGYSRRSAPNTFYNTYLQSTYVADDGGTLLNGEDIMAGLDLDVTSDPYPDSFTVGAEGTRIFKWSTADNAGGVMLDRSGYKAIYTSFDYQQISTAADEAELALRVMDYLGVSDVLWLSEAPTTGTVAAHGNQVLDVTVDASIPELAQPGEYLAQLSFKNDTPYGKLIVPVTVTVQPPADWGQLEGVVTGLGYCDEDPGPLEGAVVFIEATGGMSWTLTTDAAGAYSMWIDEDYAPLTVTVTVADHESEVATNVDINGGATTTLNFDLRWLKPCTAVDPDSLHASVAFGEAVTLTVELSNEGATAMNFEIAEQDDGYTPVAKPAAGVGRSIVTAKGNPALAETGKATREAVLGPASGGAAPEDIGTAWETMAPMPAGRVFNAVIADSNGYIYVMGGTSDAAGTTKTDTNYRYNTATNTWDTLAAMPTAVMSIDGVEINNKIYVVGDTDAVVYIYDIASNTWSQVAASGGFTARSQYQAVAIGTDMYVLGGLVGGSASTTEMWKYDTVAGTWSASVPMQKSRTSFSAGAIGDEIYVAGGVLFPGFTPDMTSEKFDGTAWSYIAGVPDGGGAYTRWSYNADAVGADGLWLAAGRRDADWAVLNHAGYYDPETNTWTDSPTIPALAQARVYMEGDVATDGYFYVIGGRDGAGAVIYTTNERLMVGYAGAGDVTWLSEDPTAGTVAADGGTLTVDVVFDSSVPEVTLPGNYFATLKVRSNDPAHGVWSIPVTMTVQAPEDFATVQGTVTGLDNCGANPAPLEGLDVVIEGVTNTFTATTNANGQYVYWMSEDEGPLLISVDGAPTYGYLLQGPFDITAGMTTTVDFELDKLAPCVSAAPAALEVDVAPGYSLSTDLVLTNDGAAAATFAVQEEPGTPLKVMPVARPTANIEVLLLTPDEGGGGDTSLIQNTLATFTDLNVTSWDGAVDGDPTAADLAAYDVVIVGNDYLWTSEGMTAAGVGDALADYIDAGGKVIDTMFVESYDNWALAGRYITDGYSCFTPSTQDFDAPPYTMGTVYDPNHAIMDGVLAVTDNPTIGYSHQDVGLAAGATRLADWNDGEIFVAFNENVVGVNQMWYHGSTWSGNVPELMHNAIVWLAGGVQPTDVPWLAEAPITGTIGADASATIDVTFTAFPTMTVGNTYTATLKVTTNDALNPTIDVPVTMHVVSEAYGVDISADQEETGMMGTVVTYTVTITNMSAGPTDSFTVTLGTSDWVTTVDASQIGPLDPGEAAVFHVAVHIPTNVVPNTSDAVQVTVTSHGDPDVYTVTTLTTHVNGYWLFMPLVLKQYPAP